MTPHQTLIARLPQATKDAIWLGALLTIAQTNGERAAEARKLIKALEADRLSVNSTKAPDSGVASAGLPVARSGIAPAVDPEALRTALAQERKIHIGYVDRDGRPSSRIIWPLDVEDFGPKGAVLAWCEKRSDFRHFRFDRIMSMQPLPERTPAPRSVMCEFAAAIMMVATYEC
ncbi:MAG: WYL domain-containing protein [Rhizobiaceae bacterium]|nr:WYL domain-containing protein [Rhizobiaceae bacterium]